MLKQKFILVHGMKRSGNHAIVNWIMSQYNFAFFNNIIPITPILYNQKTFPKPKSFSFWIFKKAISKNIKLVYPNRAYIASLEDHELYVRPFKGLPKNFTNLLIIREPYNMFSSRIRRASYVDKPIYAKQMNDNMRKIIELWKSHAREFLGETNLLCNKVCIFFDRWFIDQEYRKNICNNLNIQFTDKGFSKVSSKGGGSSFDNREYDGYSGMMNVLNRQKNLKSHESELLNTVFKDRELQNLASKIKNKIYTY